MQLIYETSYILIFFLIAKGWCLITRNIDRQEWRTILMSVCTFYMMESMLLVFKSYMQWTFWLFTAILYLTFFLSMFRSTEEIVVVLIRQLDHADESSLNVLGNLLLRRLKTMRMFQFTLGFYLLFELLIHLILDAGLQRINTTLIFHEIMELIVAFIIGYICCPNPTSRLYYQGLAPNLNSGVLTCLFCRLLFLWCW